MIIEQRFVPKNRQTNKQNNILRILDTGKPWGQYSDIMNFLFIFKIRFFREIWNSHGMIHVHYVIKQFLNLA